MGSGQTATSISKLMASGRYHEVLQQLAPLAEKGGDDPKIWILMGQCFKQLGDNGQALTLFQKANELGYSDIGLKFDIASCLYNQKQFSEALAWIPRKSAKTTTTKQIRLLAKLLLLNDKADEAEPLFSKVLKNLPEDPESNLGMARCLMKLGRVNESQEYVLKARFENETDAQTVNSYGEYWREVGDFNQAKAMYARAIEIDPTYHEALHNLGTMHLIQFRYDDARKCFREAIKANPKNPKTHVNLANAYFLASRHTAARASLNKALDLNPDYLQAKELLLTINAATCEWEEIEQSDLLSDGALVSTVYTYLSLQDDGAAQLKRALVKAHEYQKPRDHVTDKQPSAHRKIRIGYFSSDLRSHAVMYLIRQVLLMHDRSDFEIFIYSYGPDTNDKWQREVKAHADKYCDCSRWSDEFLIEAAVADELDIAVDLNGHTKDSRSQIFAHRFATVQINYLGYPGTSGVPNMDYIIADDWLIPPEKEHYYSEKVARMPHSYQPNDCYREISGKYTSRRDCKLPEGRFVFANLNAPHKIGRKEVEVWAEILAQVPNSVIWLFEANKWAKKNILDAFLKRGVISERIIFAQRDEPADHLSRLQFIDLFLDSFAYTAHTTASDCLWAGAPVLTMVGDQFAARVGASIVSAAGLNDLITRSLNEYIDLAVELSTNPQKLLEVRDRIGGAKNARLPLFDSSAYTKDLENLYKTLLTDART